jgi:CCR4-NOT transcription complex subunit 1
MEILLKICLLLLRKLLIKIKSILNSITKNNLTEKAKEIKTIINSEKIERWFSNFFVNKLSGENNNYQIYNDLITSIDSFELNKYMTKDTIFYIRKLLNSENIDKSIKEQNVLKNLGSWLGIITLSKNRPILAKDLDMKELIIDAYENGKLNIIIIFISKIL